jgi:TPR repeat protein
MLLRATLALKICREVAESGNGNAQFYLGKLYAEGKGVPQNSNEAIRWYKMAHTRQTVWIHLFFIDYLGSRKAFLSQTQTAPDCSANQSSRQQSE